MLAPNLMSVSQLHLSLSGFPEGTAEAPSGPSSRKDPDEGIPRRSPPSGCTSSSSVGRCSASAPKDENDGPVRRDGRVFCRSAKATSKTHAAGHVLPFAAPVAGKPVVLASRRKLGPVRQLGAHSALLLMCHCTRQGRNPRKIGGMTPSSSCASVDEGGQAPESEGGGGHGARGGNWRGGLLRRLARRGSASLRRGRGSALARGVQRDGQWRGQHLPENVEFGPETGKTTVPLAAKVAHVRKVRSDAGCRRRRCARQLDVFREARRAGNRLLSCLRTSRRSCRPSRPTVTTAPPCATHGVDKVGTISATRRRRKRRFLSANSGVLPQAQAPPTRASRPGAARSGVVRQQGRGQPTHEAGALERRRRPERPRLQGDVGPRRVAGDDRAARTTA